MTMSVVRGLVFVAVALCATGAMAKTAAKEDANWLSIPQVSTTPKVSAKVGQKEHDKLLKEQDLMTPQKQDFQAEVINNPKYSNYGRAKEAIKRNERAQGQGGANVKAIKQDAEAQILNEDQLSKNIAVIKQDGVKNSSTIVQTGKNNEAVQIQTGVDNDLWLSQTGLNNKSTEVQTGKHNRKTKVQNGVVVKAAPKAEVKAAPKVEAKAATKAEPKAEAKVEPKAESSIEQKVEAKTEPKAELKAEPKTETKADPKAEQKTAPKG